MDIPSKEMSQVTSRGMPPHETHYEQPPPPPYSQEAYSGADLGTYPTRTPSNNQLQKPIAIPATTSKVGSPFLRAYPPSIEGFGLPKEVFMQFLDDLNRVAVAFPPLQVLGLAGSIVSFVPLHEAQIIGGSINAAATLATYVISKSRTEIHLRRANRDIFKPRGLKVEIAKLDALAKVAGMPVLNAEGKVDKKTPLLDPVESWELTSSITGQERRLRAFEPWIAHLDLADLPAINVSSNPLSKWSKHDSERQREKGEKKMLKSRGKAYRKGQVKPLKADQKYERKMLKLDVQAETGKSLAKIEKKREKAERRHDKRLGKVEKVHMKNKEEKGLRKILWLIVRNLDADSGEGRDPYTEDISGEESSLDELSTDETSSDDYSSDEIPEKTK